MAMIGLLRSTLPAALLAFNSVPVVAAEMPMASASVTIVSPAPGATITSNDIPVTVSTEHFTVECAHVGQPGVPGRGNIHAMLDGMTMDQLTNFYCSKPAMVSFNYRPTNPHVLPGPKAESAKRSVTVLSPAKGATVGKHFDLKLAVHNFTPSCNLEGRPDIAGYGHIHVFVTQAGVTDKKSYMPMAMEPMGGSPTPMMSLVGMIGMPCASTIPVNLSTWHSGPAKILVMLVGNDHNPLPGVAPAAITVDVK